ncbi:hypothetical protein [Mesorhizobium sp. SP-1A]|uniref:DUF7146 domain-containing protein n=1 Tax=Mesorhizobium sp. SP-1A TaxID=3077840 RepID=UPI0028F70ED5|nr:hypothetical protein [Mesorhizobium sp. SP-1A]
MNLQFAARALGGNVAGHASVACPGPGHGRNDRSLSVTFDEAAPDGFLVNSFAGDDFAACRDHVRYLLGFGSFEPRRQKDQQRRPFVVAHQEPDTGKRVEFAASLWREARAIGRTLAETYLCGRGIDIPGGLYAGDVLRFHPAWRVWSLKLKL